MVGAHAGLVLFIIERMCYSYIEVSFSLDSLNVVPLSAQSVKSGSTFSECCCVMLCICLFDSEDLCLIQMGNYATVQRCCWSV